MRFWNFMSQVSTDSKVISLAKSASPAKSNRIPSLDGLRAISIAFVILGHVYETPGYPKNAVTKFLMGYSHFGVQVFFVISGFLITTLLLKETEKTGRINLLDFYKRRALRIFPAAFAYVGIMGAVFALARHPLPGKYLAYALTYTMCYASQARPWHLGHLWSLSVEEQFYLLWPFAMALFFRYRKQIGWGVLLVVPILRFLAFRHGWHDIDEYFPTVADNVAAGCLLAIYRPQMQRSAWMQRLTHPAFAVLLALLTVVSPLFLFRVRIEILAGGILPLLIALTIFVAVERKDWFLNNWLMAWIGVLSYSLYLWQQPFLNRHDPEWWTSFPTNVALTVGAAVLSYNLIEKPFLSYRKKTTLPVAGVKATATAV